MKLRLPPNTKPHKSTLDFSLATVNIVLLLIFFFLISGSLVATEEMEVDMSETADLPLETLPRPLLLMRPEGETWLLDGIPVTREALPETTRGDLLHILADKSLPASALISLLRDPALDGITLKLVTLRKFAGDGS